MKKMITAALLISSLSLSSAALFAERGENSEHTRMDKKLEHMTEKLDLTEDQINKIKPILTAQHESMKAIQEQNKKAISAYLNEDQKAKLGEMKKCKNKGKKGHGKRKDS